MERLGVVVAAAGKGARMGTGIRKQFLPLAGKPVVVHALERFQAMPEVDAVVLVTGAEDVALAERLVRQYGLSKVGRVVAGRGERQHSVAAGLDALDDDIQWVMVHDGVRPFIRERELRRLYAAVKEAEAAVLAVPVKETIKIVRDGWIEETPRRETLWVIQTPQAFRLPLLKQAHEKARSDGFVGTDDAVLVERLGHKVRIVEGQYSNIKITTPEDLRWGEQWLKKEWKENGGGPDRTGI